MRVYDDPLIDEAALFAIAAQLLAHPLIAVNARDQHGSPSLFPLINRASRAFARFEKLLAALPISKPKTPTIRQRPLILTAILHNPEDSNPDNYIVQRFINHEGQAKDQFISIDNDHTFVPPFSKDWRGREQLEVKCILFCLDLMNTVSTFFEKGFVELVMRFAFNK